MRTEMDEVELERGAEVSCARRGETPSSRAIVREEPSTDGEPPFRSLRGCHELLGDVEAVLVVAVEVVVGDDESAELVGGEVEAVRVEVSCSPPVSWSRSEGRRNAPVRPVIH